MPLSTVIKAGLSKAVKSPVLWDAPLSAWTTFRIGGPADALVTIRDIAELQAVLFLCSEHGIDWKLLGRGSNVLAADDGFPGVIIVLGEGFKACSRKDGPDGDKVLVEAGAALGLSRLADWSAEQGLSGLEFAAGIPGTLGGGVLMNAGAWGSAIGNLVFALTLADKEKSITVAGKDLRFGYRCLNDMKQSLLGFVITGAQLELVSGKTLAIQETMKEFRRRRREHQPVGMANAGSFFKNPAGASAGRLIEAAGLKGLRVGDAEVSEKHANFFVNRGCACARDMIELMYRVQEAVKKDSGVDLEPEVHFLK